MTDAELDALEEQVPALAAEAIAAANQRARESGRPRVFVEDGKLVSIEGETKTELKAMPFRVKVSDLPQRPTP
jgi:hypothetical protein